MLEAMTAGQLAEWEAYDRLEPIGGYRQDYMIGSVIKIVLELAQAVYGRKGRTLSCTPWDFVPWRPDVEQAQVKRQSVEEMRQVLQMLAKKKVKK